MLALEQVLDMVDELASSQRSVSELPGGLTNANHRVSTPSGSYVVRRWSDDTGLLAIDRDNEYETRCAPPRSVSARASSPTCRAQHDGAGVDRGSHAERRASCNAASGSKRSRRPAGACTARAAFATTSTCSRSSRGICRSFGARLSPAGALRRVRAHVAAIREAFTVRDEGTMPCNNDLLAEN